MRLNRSELISLLGVVAAAVALPFTVLSAVIPLFPQGVLANPLTAPIMGGVAAFLMLVLLVGTIMFVRNRLAVIPGKPVVLTPLVATEHDIELWSETSNSFFDTPEFYISAEWYRAMYEKAPHSFRIIKSRSTGEVVGGYLLLFLASPQAEAVMRGELFMVDITPEMLVEARDASLVHLCDVVVSSKDAFVKYVLIFDLFSELIGTCRALANVKNVTGHSIGAFYEAINKQMGFSYKPLKHVERTGRKLWVAEAATFRTASWATTRLTSLARSTASSDQAVAQK